MSQSKSNKSFTDDLKAAIAGIQEVMGSKAVMLGGQSQTPNQIIVVFQGYVTKSNQSDQAKQTAKKAAADCSAQRPATRKLYRALVKWVKATYGEDEEMLGKFGMPVAPAKAKPSAEEQAATNAKRRQTLEQKKALKDALAKGGASAGTAASK
jgi:hypothetical protein